MYTPRVGENTVYDSPLLSPRAPPTPLCWLSFALCTVPGATYPPLLQKQFVQRDLQLALNINTFGEI